MRTSVKAFSALAAALLLSITFASAVSAGTPSFGVIVESSVRCLPTGEAEITWDVTVTAVSPVDEEDDPPILVPLGAVQGIPSSNAGLLFSGTQSGAATGAVTFDPNDIIVPASDDSFPVSTRGVKLAPGTTGGTVDLDVEVVIYNVGEPDTFFEAFGAGSAELPICEQPIATSTPSSAPTPTEVTRPRFTG